MNLSPKVLGFVRGILSAGIFGAVLAVLTFASDATHFNGLLNDGLAALIAGLAGRLEHSLEEKGSGALFGAVRVRS